MEQPNLLPATGPKPAGKQPVIDKVLAEQAPMFERAQRYVDDPSLVRGLIEDGCEKARDLAKETMREVRDAMGLHYS